ncbi:MAG: glycosyl hydrolase 115 family protein [Butyrivibrio sp.]|nr:glycosyl hydrolase 115 family protein [Butyrivibrio sp.]
MSIVLTQNSKVVISINDNEDEAVQIAANNLKADLEKVVGCSINLQKGGIFFDKEKIYISIATIGNVGKSLKSPIISLDRDENGIICKEAFSIHVEENVLYIAGADRRGTIYGIYEFCEKKLMVSPWYFMADVPIKRRDKIVIEDSYLVTDHPEIEYRGIFINDEEELEKWVQNYMGEETIGVKTYEKIFELLLRLKLNYIWPAMHVNSFNMVVANGDLANRMGIVVGTSHCDMLMRSNNREWFPWLKQKGYEGIQYDFSIPGKNRDVLKEYWSESVKQNKDFEVSYTLGMRGIHDSGFETEELKRLKGEKLRQAKIKLLEDVIDTQENILKKELGEDKNDDTLKIFVPYKEVLELYDNGLKVPDDLTLIWCNDNYGYVRRYPDKEAQKRKAGNGIYYHNSYWAPPAASYLFICSIPMAMTRNELLKSYDNNIRKLWVTNFGAIKPLEQQLSYYAQLCWDAKRENAPSSDPCEWLELWLDRTFNAHFGDVLAPCLIEFDQLTNTRKLEHMDIDIFAQDAYGDEAADRIHRYENIIRTANSIYEKLDEEYKDAFFQMIMLKLHAAYYTNAMYYYADRSNMCMKYNKASAAGFYTQKSLEYDHARRALLHFYNHVMSNGKWNGIVTPEDFPPPRTALHPACKPPIKKYEDKLIVTSCYNSELNYSGDILIKFNYGGKVVKSFELSNAGDSCIKCSIKMPLWLSVINCPKSEIRDNENIYDIDVIREKRLLLKIDWNKLRQNCANDKNYSVEETVYIKDIEHKDEYDIRVAVLFNDIEDYKKSFALNKKQNRKQNNVFSELANIEDDYRIVIKANNYISCKGFREIPYLGRDNGYLLEAMLNQNENNISVVIESEAEYIFYVYEDCEKALLELHRFPSLDSVGTISCEIEIDGEAFSVISESNDEHRGNWKYNIKDNVDKLYIDIPGLKRGKHTLTVKKASRYFAFSRIIIYTKGLKKNSLGIITIDERAVEDIDPMSMALKYYNRESCKMGPRPVYYLKENAGRNTLLMEDELEIAKSYGSFVTGEEILALSNKIISERNLDNYKIVHIEAASALGETSFARTSGQGWEYCNSPAHGETGLAMYIRQEGRTFEENSNAPSLHYRIKVSGGIYKIWVRLYMWGPESSHFTIGVDGELFKEEELFNGVPIWRYSNENIWKWIPLTDIELSEGEHEIVFVCLSSRLRLEQIYMSTGKEKPPIEYSV